MFRFLKSVLHESKRNLNKSDMWLTYAKKCCGGILSSMKRFSLRRSRAILAALATLGFVSVIYLANIKYFQAPKVEALTTQNISGWIWSENIGWVSLNNTSDGSAVPYGVNIDATNKAAGGTGDFAGSGWSSGLDLAPDAQGLYEGGVGWISFNRGETGNPPGAPYNAGVGPIARIDWSTGKVTGWARVLSGCESTPGTPATLCLGTGAGAAAGGWDGWIKLSKDAGDTGPSYGVVLAGNKFAGYAWGSDTVGWVDFAPTVSGLFVGAEVAVSSCIPTDLGIIWGTCQPLPASTCVPPAVSQTFASGGIQVGLCPAGGTTTQVCSVTVSCTAPSTAPSGKKSKYYQF